MKGKCVEKVKLGFWDWVIMIFLLYPLSFILSIVDKAWFREEHHDD